MYTLVRASPSASLSSPQEAQAQPGRALLPDQAHADRAMLPDQAQPGQLQASSATATGTGVVQGQTDNAVLPAQAPAQHRPMDECGFAEGDMLVLSIEGAFHLLTAFDVACYKLCINETVPDVLLGTQPGAQRKVLSYALQH